MLTRSLLALATALLIALGAGCSDAPGSEEFAWSLPIQSWPGGFLSVSGSSADDVWVVGASIDGSPSILRWRGDRWESVAPPTDNTIWWVHVLDASTVYVGGDGNTVARWNGSAFESLEPPGEGNETVYGVWARSAQDLYAVGVKENLEGFVWHWNGVRWNELALPGASGGAVFKVWGNAERVYVVRADGAAFVRRSGDFEAIDTGADSGLLTVTGCSSGSGSSDVLAVGGSGSALVAQLAPEASHSTLRFPFLQGVACDDAGDFWASGGRGTLLRRRDGNWARVDTGFQVPGQSLHAVWVDPEGGVWAVGGDIITLPITGGVLLHGARNGNASPLSFESPAARCDAGMCLDAGLGDAGLGDAGLDAGDALTDSSDAADTGIADFPAPIGSEPDGDRALGIGTGHTSYVPLRHGDPIRWEAGSQGGYHIWLTSRLDEGIVTSLSEAERQDISTSFFVTRRDGTPLGDLTRLGGYRLIDGSWDLIGNFSVLPPGIRPSRLDDEALQVTVQVRLPRAPEESFERRVWLRSECCD